MLHPRCWSLGAAVPRLLGQRQDQRVEQGRLRALIIARPLALTLAVGFGIALDGELFVPGARAGAWVLLISYTLSGIYILLSALRVRHGFQLGLQLVLDVALVTALVSVTGGVNSQYVLLYFVLILYASMLLSFGGALAASVLSAAAYLFSWTPALVSSRLVGPDYGNKEAVVKILFHGLLFVTVGVLGGFLARRAEQKERKLRDTASELRRVRLGTDVIIQSIKSGIMSIDSEGKVVHFNEAASDILGLDPAEVRGKYFEEALNPGMAAVARALRRGLHEGETVFRGEMEIESGDGRKVPLGINTSLIRTESGGRAGVVALCQDLTEAKRMDEKAKRQETLAALGQFSAGIAHEIRNCLSPITGSVELLKNELSPEGDSEELMGLILKETDRLEVFLTELLFYARAKPPEKQSVSLQELVEETVELLRRHPAYSERKVIECKFLTPDIHVNVDREQMKRVLVNLAVNALEAIDSKGTLTISTSLDAGAGEPPERHRPEATVEFKDNGQGIAPEDLCRILEPFYSTKGSGTGLGLSIAQRVLEGHGGKLSIESALGKGAKATIHIPCSVADRVDTACTNQKAA
ncbi:MAG: PAS domain S-box protein [Candidatus Eiseniibacteriota bacterium]|nr:MAG: PAS domain S-box protein [Candidatus Eisenbacteria bacterium]